MFLLRIDISFSQSFVNRFSLFLKQVEEKLLAKWLESAKISKQDPFYDEVIENAKHTIHLIDLYIETKEVAPIIELTKKIARERIEANINISEFVENINIGRSIVTAICMETDRLVEEDKLLSIMVVNQMFDSYVYYAVKEYTNLKDSIISEKSKFIKEMHHDRLTILGQIAASFAHEFRNPLASIKGFISLLEKKYRDDQESHFYFSVIDQEMISLQDKISRFLYLSKTKGLDDEMIIFNLSKVANMMIEFMYPRFVDEKIKVRSSIQEECYIFAVEEQVKQILLNILNNAVEELTERKDNRKIDIELKAVNDKVEVEISNNGKMIPAHLVDNIFQPFVTTKDLGTGLGLAVVKQIVDKHDAVISVESNMDKTTFKILWNKVKEEVGNHY